MIRVMVNGQNVQLVDPTTISQLLGQLQIPQRGVAVELNCAVVPQPAQSTRPLVDGDQVEIVSLTGGG